MAMQRYFALIDKNITQYIYQLLRNVFGITNKLGTFYSFS